MLTDMDPAGLFQFVSPGTKFTWISLEGKDYRIGTLRYNWLMSAHASQAFSTSTVPIRKIYHLKLCKKPCRRNI